MAPTRTKQPVIRVRKPLSQEHFERPWLGYQTSNGEGLIRPDQVDTGPIGAQKYFGKKECGELGRHPPRGGKLNLEGRGASKRETGPQGGARRLEEGIRTLRGFSGGN